MALEPADLAADLADCEMVEAQRRIVALFTAAGLDTPALDARRLLAGACGIEPGDVLLHPSRTIAADEARRLSDFVRRRRAREPVSRILGIRAFHGLDFEVTPATLDPRPETETLVDGVLAVVRSGACAGGEAPRILDVGTGTGAILLALLAALPRATGVGVDIDPDALEVAGRNAERHGLARRVTFARSDWLDAVEGRFDVIVSNPPYIPRGDIAGLDPDVRCHDPLRALDGGEDGLDAYRVLIPAAADKLNAGGWLAMEVGDGQAPAAAALLQSVFGRLSTRTEVRHWTDMAGKPRCVAVQHL